MWHNPRLLNGAAGVLSGFALVLFALSALQLLLRPTLFPLREMVVSGILKHTVRAEIERAARSPQTGNFFAVDLAEVREAFERLPWVRRVTVRRIWPDRLDITIEEHAALAVWSGGGLVNTYGEPFPAQGGAPLPIFSGPPGSEREVARRHHLFAARLATLGMNIERVVLSPRHAWQLHIAGGPRIVLGRDAADDLVEARLARFAAAYPQSVQRLAGGYEYVDLRYANGFALRVPNPQRDTPPAPQRRG